MNISFRAGINTFLTLETVTFYPRRSIFRKSDVRRTFLRTCLTSFDAVFPISVKSEKRQDRKQRKNCSHRTKISAEKTFFKAHSCKDQNQKLITLKKQTTQQKAGVYTRQHCRAHVLHWKQRKVRMQLIRHLLL